MLLCLLDLRFLCSKLMVIKIWKILIDASGAMKDKKYGLKRFMRYRYDHNPLTGESLLLIIDTLDKWKV